MEDVLPVGAIAHVVMKVRDVEASYEFYAALGLRPFGKFPGMGVIELRGGTHLLLFQEDDAQSASLIPSRTGQRPDYGAEKLDLMIQGHGRDDLDRYRAALLARGFQPSEISLGTLYGHHHFSMTDPDGAGITFYTSHCGELPV